ncbi:GlcNAc-PI de-N-acetylase [Gemmatimonadetes bacterium T265]|nr:GlcNAc-PI de-N-acetylase [Gemmatimonadetes bacterium T265]
MTAVQFRLALFRRVLALAVVSTLAPTLRAQTSTAYEPRGAAELAQLVDGLGMTARVLVVGAHPDDEDTRLVAYLARGRHAETAYLSLTRGDGGQNLIGNELGDALGAIRTEELLAARRIDGGHQYFTRAYDFGFSKTAAETFQHWPHDTVLGDVVRVVRAFRPHVMIAIFSGTPADGHGHHQASGILAREAYDAALDTVRFPVREFGPAWGVGKFYRNTSYRGSETATLRYNAGAYDPVLGRSYAELAAISRSQHKSQGQGGLERKGVSVVSMRREATRVNAGTPADQEHDLFDGIDTTVARLRPPAPALATDSLLRAVAAVEVVFDPRHPERAAPALAHALRLTYAVETAVGLGERAEEHAPTQAGRDAGATVAELSSRISRALEEALGVAVEATAPREVVALGDTVSVSVRVYNRGVRTLRVRLGGDSPGAGEFTSVPPDSVFSALVRWPADVRRRSRTEPYWLERGRAADLFAVAPAMPRTAGDVSWCCVPEAFGPDHDVELQVGTNEGAATFALGAPIKFRYADPVKGDVRRPLAFAPAVSVTLDRPVQYARANVPLDRVVTVHLRSASTVAGTATVRLELPAGLSADSAIRTVTLPGYDARAAVDFRVRGTLRPGRTVIRASAESKGERFTTGYQLVDYDHIRPQRLYRPAETAIHAVDVALPPHASVAYVPGVGDNVAPTLADLGLAVTTLDSTALGTGDLSKYTHVVIGPRAYDANPALAANNARLLDWVRRGGTMVVQYGQYEMTRPGIMPYPITLGRPAQRVTLEDAPVTVLDPSAGVLTAPNRIGAADWAGWVQERSTYMPQTADPRYRTAVAINDPGEAPNPNGILVAPVGRGTYVYVTLAMFRQLPAGVPGAARLTANLLAARAGAVSADAGRPASGR